MVFITSHHKKRKHYEALSGFLKVEDLPRLKHPTANKLNENEVKALLRYREMYGKGVRQRSVRADTTKYNAGTLPLNLYTIDDETTNQPISFQNTKGILTKETETFEENRSVQIHALFEVGDVTVLVIDNIFIAVVVEIASNTCKVNIYEEIGGLRFKYPEQRSVSTDCVTKLPETSYVFVNEQEYVLDEDVYNTLKSNKETEQISMTEQIELIDIEMNNLTTETRRGRRIVPARSSDYYYF